MSKLQKTFSKNVLMHLGDRNRSWLAKASGILSGSLTTAVSEDGNATLKTVEAISNALNVHPAELLGGSAQKGRKIPADILEMLDGESDAVYSAVRSVLKAVSTETAVRNSRAKNKA